MWGLNEMTHVLHLVQEQMSGKSIKIGAITIIIIIIITIVTGNDATVINIHN